MRADSTLHMWYNYSRTLIPVGDYDSEFGSFFQSGKQREMRKISATVNRIRNSVLVILKILLIWPCAVVQKVDNAIHWVNLYPQLDSAVVFPNTYQPDKSPAIQWTSIIALSSFQNRLGLNYQQLG